MTVALLLLAISGLVVATAVVVRRDGYGHRPPPRSTRPWDDHGLPSHPYSRHS